MRILGLDLLRLIAVILVLVRHVNLPDQANIVLRIGEWGGWVGVDLFFVLSGFLVSLPLFREYQQNGTVDVKHFLLRRAFKIYPAFWCYLLLTFCVSFVLERYTSWRSLLSELLFVQNYFGSYWFEHTWSLAVEEHFYLGVAALFAYWVWLKPEHSFSTLPAMFVGIGFLCLLFRIINLFAFPEYSYWHHHYGTHIRIDSLCFGVLISYYHVFHQLDQKLAFLPGWILFLVGGVLLAPAFVYPLETTRWIPVIGFILFYVGSGAILMGALRLSKSRSIFLNYLGVLGASSYSIYLWHLPMNHWGWRLVERMRGLESYSFYLLFYLFGSCLLGFVMSRMIEVPALRLRNSLFPSGLRSTPRIEFSVPGPIQVENGQALKRSQTEISGL